MHVALPDHAVVVEGDRIADVTTAPPADATQLDMPGDVVLPGMINLHNHTLNAPVFRSIVDDLPRGGVGPSKVCSMLMPIGGLAVTAHSPDELGDLVAVGLLEVARSGATTLVDQFRQRQAMILDLARAMGLRFYGAPHLFSPSDTKTDAEVARAARGSFEGASGLASFSDLHARHDGGAAGRLRVILGPHAADSCDPDLLQEADRLSRELDTMTLIHAAQRQSEVDRVRERHGVDVASYLARNGLLRPRVILAHGVFFSDDELARVVASGAGRFLRGDEAMIVARGAAAGSKLWALADAQGMLPAALTRA